MEIKARIEARSLLLSKVGRLRERRRTTRTKRTAKDCSDDCSEDWSDNWSEDWSEEDELLNKEIVLLS